MRDFMEVHHELQDLFESCLPRTKRFFRRVDALLDEEEQILKHLANTRNPDGNNSRKHL